MVARLRSCPFDCGRGDSPPEPAGVGRHRPDDAVSVAAGPELIGVQGESRLEPKRLEHAEQVVRVAIADGPAIEILGLYPRVIEFGLSGLDGRSGPCGSVPQAIHPRDGKRDSRHGVSSPPGARVNGQSRSVVVVTLLQVGTCLPEVHVHQLHERISEAPTIQDLGLYLGQGPSMVNGEPQDAIDEESIQERIGEAPCSEAIDEQADPTPAGSRPFRAEPSWPTCLSRFRTACTQL